MSYPTTTAELIAEAYGNGQTWAWHGMDLHDLCISMNAGNSSIGDSDWYQFADGSVIVANAGAWALGHSWPATCHCWPEAYSGGHSDECKAAG